MNVDEAIVCHDKSIWRLSLPRGISRDVCVLVIRLPALLSELRAFQQDLHRPPPLQRDILVTNGAQHGIYQTLDLLMDEGDPILLTEYTYTGVHVAVSIANDCRCRGFTIVVELTVVEAGEPRVDYVFGKATNLGG